MGEEIEQARFVQGDFREFRRRLAAETRLFLRALYDGACDAAPPGCGFETELNLVDARLEPTPVNDRLLRHLDHPLLAPELARFNLEINSVPRRLTGRALAQAQRELCALLELCREAAADFDARPGLFGILPTLRPEHLGLEAISPLNCYRALNEQLLAQRRGRPLRVRIEGVEALDLAHPNVMLEAATTSFQLHLSAAAAPLRALLNAALQAAAPCLAAATNAPFLFGRRLWAETRIPLFEQAAEAGGYAAAAHGPLRRVGFGSGYVRRSLGEWFEENLDHFPPLLPILFDTPPERFAHLRLHNGTIWRWVRPLVAPGEGGPRLRLEFRVLPAGPSVVDAFANAAFFYGLVWALAAAGDPAARLEFAAARDNFYRAARHGLAARLVWHDGRVRPAAQLILERLLPAAADGLAELGVDAASREAALGVLRERVQSGLTGAEWQQRFAARGGGDMRALTRAYLEGQDSGRPVHLWPLPAARSDRDNTRLWTFDRLSPALLDAPAHALYRHLPGPSLFELPGRRPGPALFVSVLLHGNEDGPWRAVQRVLRRFDGGRLPRPLLLFVGNVAAARYGLRRLAGQADYNRAWPGTDLPPCPETRLFQALHARLARQPLFAAVDLHNNTGRNPHYACVSRLAGPDLQLALLFSRTVVYFTRPAGVAVAAMARLCPAVTLECGRPDDEDGVARAERFLLNALHMPAVESTPPAAEDIDVFHSVVQLRIAEGLSFSFGEAPADLALLPDLEQLNFRELSPGTPLGDCAALDRPPLVAVDEAGRDVFDGYFEVRNGLLRLRRAAVPAMFTRDRLVIRQDCLGYLMHRVAVPAATTSRDE